MTTQRNISEILLKKISSEFNYLHLNSIKLLNSGSRIHICIHELRTNNKKIRALLRLFRANTDNKKYLYLNTFYRDMNRQIAIYRDISSQIELLSSIKKDFRNEEVQKAIIHTIGQLKSNRKIIIQEYLKSSVRSSYSKLMKENLDKMSDLQASMNVETIVSSGIKNSYRKSSGWLKKCIETKNDNDFHEFRKNVKYLLYQLKTVRELWPVVINAYISELTLLSNYLGNIHDLSLFREMISQNKIELKNPKLKKSLQASLRNHQNQLKNKSLMLARLLFNEKPDAFAGRLAGYYNSLKIK